MTQINAEQLIRNEANKISMNITEYRTPRPGRGLQNEGNNLRFPVKPRPSAYSNWERPFLLPVITHSDIRT